MSSVCCAILMRGKLLLLVSIVSCVRVLCGGCFVFQAEDGIRDLVRSRGLGDVYKRQGLIYVMDEPWRIPIGAADRMQVLLRPCFRIAEALSLIHI